MSSQLDSWVSNPGETRGPLLSAILWSLFAVATLFLGLRLVIRHTTAKIWIDDYVLVSGWILFLVSVILNQLAINLGFGRHALDIDFQHFDQITYYEAAGLSTSCIGINLAKISFGLTLIRLTKAWPRYFVYFAMATLIIFAIPIAIIPWVQCRPVAKAFVDILPGTCIDKRPSIKFGQFQAVWSAIMDIALAFIPWTILWDLKMRITDKIGVGIAMSLGVFAGVTAIIRGHYIDLLTHQDISYDAPDSLVWAAAEAVATIVATSIPVLRVFIQKAVTSAVTNYNSSKSRSDNTTTNKSSLPNSRLARASAQLSCMTANNPSEEIQQEPRGHVPGKATNSWIILNDLSDNGINEAPKPQSAHSLSDAEEQKVEKWPL